MKPCVALLVFCTLSIPAFSANHLYNSGNDFLSECSGLDRANDSTLTNVEMAKNMQCLSYVEGLIDGAFYESVRTKADGKLKMGSLPFCRPEGVNNLQLARVALKYVRDNPEKAHLTTAVLVFEALKNAFPCSEKR
jgi:Rap1a immunity proteins